MIEPSEYQKDIYKEVKEGTGSLIINAVAGSGKTTTIVTSLSYINDFYKVLFLAFNKGIVESLKTKVPSHIKVQTLHGFGFTCMLRYKKFKKPAVIPNKTRNIYQKMVGNAEFEAFGPFVCQLVSLAKQHGMHYCLDDTYKNWWNLVDHFCLYVDTRALIIDYLDDVQEAIAEFDYDLTEWQYQEALEAVLVRRYIGHAQKVLRQSNEAEETIDFDDMMYFPLLKNMPITKYNIVLLDESQDTNVIRRELLKKALTPGGRVIAVGDKHQCQPAGTKIYVTGKGYIPIEELKEGQGVMSYNRSWFSGIIRSSSVIEKIQSRSYDGDLITIEAGNYMHKVTLTHKCLVRLVQEKGYIVYVMRKGKYARIGCCSQKYGKGFGLTGRATEEKADEAWILKYFSNRQEAEDFETLTAYKYGLPQIQFDTSSHGLGRTKERLINIWFRLGSNITSLHTCLKAFNKSALYPFWAKNVRNYSGSFCVKAINLIDGLFAVCIYNKGEKPQWVPARIAREKYKGKVWSLQVTKNYQGRGLYVAEGIVTHNSIYGFTGASSNAMDLIQKQFDCVSFPLNICYRCSTDIVKEAQRINSTIEPWENAPKGMVKKHKSFKASSLVVGDRVLCRNTAPLVSLAYSLLAKGTPVGIIGKSIGGGLIALINKFKFESLPQLIEDLNAYTAEKIAEFKKRRQEHRIEPFMDRIQSLLAILYSIPKDTSKKGIIGSIKKLFDNKTLDNKVLFSTIHKSKGLEWDRVYILDYKLMPSKYAISPWQKQQEENLKYVAITRAKKELHFIDSAYME